VIGRAAPDRDRVAYLRDTARLLWPPPARVTAAGGAGGDLLVLPGLARPRLLVPAGRRPAAAAVRRYGEPGSRRAQLGSRALSLLLGSGLGPYLLRNRLAVRAPAGAPTIETYLSSALGRDLVVSMHIGAPRANRKPVLQLLSPHGETLGFAKIGVNALTSELVRAERDTLREIGGTRLGSLTVPRVLHHGTWQQLDVLVLSPLPVWLRRRPLARPQLAIAMGEVAALGGIRRQPLGASDYWQRLRLRVSAADAGEDRACLLHALDLLAARAAEAELAFGCWHGDWTPWNMACTGDGLLVWDWERFGSGVPLGFDALHYWLQARVVASRRDPAAAAAGCAARAADLLRPLGVTAAAAELTVALYLAELAARYLGDRQADAGARLGAPGRWLIPALAAAVTPR
jgi:Phosphotransferase enzyme family